jgi:hypothetical protein
MAIRYPRHAQIQGSWCCRLQGARIYRCMTTHPAEYYSVYYNNLHLANYNSVDLLDDYIRVDDPRYHMNACDCLLCAPAFELCPCRRR